MAKQKNGEVEFWRFIFSVIIVIHHSKYLTDGFSLFKLGSFAVEFFFLVSGCLFMASVEKNEKLSGGPGNLGKETLEFLKKKIKGIYPEVIISTLIAYVFVIFTCKDGVFSHIEKLTDFFVGDTLLLRMTGLGDGGLNGPLWYVSAMLIVMAVYYPFIRKYKDIACKVVIPLVSLFVLGYLIKDEGSILNPAKWDGFFYRGTLRAFGDIGLGIVIYYASNALSRVSLNNFGKICVSGVKWFCYGTVIAWMFISRGNFDSICLVFMFTALCCTFSLQSIEAKLFNNRVVFFLGRLSMPLFLSHYYLCSSQKTLSSLNNVLPSGLSYYEKLIIYLICSFITALFVMFISSLYRKKRESVIKTIKKIFTK